MTHPSWTYYGLSTGHNRQNPWIYLYDFREWMRGPYPTSIEVETQKRFVYRLRRRPAMAMRFFGSELDDPPLRFPIGLRHCGDRELDLGRVPWVGQLPARCFFHDGTDE